MNSIVRLLKPFVEKIPFLSMIYRTARTHFELKRQPTQTSWGFGLSGNPGMESGKFEPELTNLVRDICSSTDSFLNIGANIGYYCAHALDKGNTVYAVEPMHRNLQFLYKNMEVNGWSSGEIEVFPMGVSDSPGIYTIYGENTGASLIAGWAGISENWKTAISVSTIDTIFKNRFSMQDKLFALVDIEGAELSMLEGASHFLENTDALWVVEIVPTLNMVDGNGINPNFVKVFKIFHSFGYKSFAIDNGLSEVHFNKPAQLARVNPSVSNFLFVRPSNFLFDEKIIQNT